VVILGSNEDTPKDPEFTVLNDKVARKIQLRLINKLYQEMETNPSASLFAVVERQLARLNMGLVDLPEDTEMSEEEKQMIKDFEGLDIGLNSDLFETEH